MNTSPTLYTIRETPCFPCSFKLIPANRAGECWKESNAWVEFFRSRAEAVAEIARRGAQVKD